MTRQDEENQKMRRRQSQDKTWHDNHKTTTRHDEDYHHKTRRRQSKDKSTAITRQEEDNHKTRRRQRPCSSQGRTFCRTYLKSQNNRVAIWTLCCPVLSRPVLTYHVLPCPALSSLFLSYRMIEFLLPAFKAWQTKSVFKTRQRQNQERTFGRRRWQIIDITAKLGVG